MAKINKEEYELLKSLEGKWKWIAKDGERNSLNVFSVKPIKIHSRWDYIDVGYKHARLTKEESKMLQFIQWEDEEPYNIQELIEEYEDSTEHVSHVLNERVKALGKARSESEETEVKSKQDLIEKWESAIESAEFYGKGKEEELISYMKDFVSDLSQLDEPEVLSQEWIDDNTWNHHYVGEPFVYVEDLKNKIVPKQEEVDRAYKDGYEKGKQHTFYKSYLEGLADKESINPARSPEVDRHKELLDELNDLYARKNQDYGNSFDESLDKHGLLVLKIRLGDKYKRFSQLISNDQMVGDESTRDTLIDLANYALMGVMWMDKNGEEEDEHNNYH